MVFFLVSGCVTGAVEHCSEGHKCDKAVYVSDKCPNSAQRPQCHELAETLVFHPSGPENTGLMLGPDPASHRGCKEGGSKMTCWGWFI